MTAWEAVMIACITMLSGVLTYQARVWYHQQWLKHFRKHKAFRPMPKGFGHDTRSTRDNYPQDHP